MPRIWSSVSCFERFPSHSIMPVAVSDSASLMPCSSWEK